MHLGGFSQVSQTWKCREVLLLATIIYSCNPLYKTLSTQRVILLFHLSLDRCQLSYFQALQS